MNFQRGFAAIEILIVVIFAIGAYLIYQKSIKPINIVGVPFIATYEECIKASGSKITDGYPKLCESREGKTYIEQIAEGINAGRLSDWKEVKTNSGFSFKCPPYWNCSQQDDIDLLQGGYVASAYNTGYVKYSLLFGIIKAIDFQQSLYRHPSYKNGVDWFNDLLARNPKSIEVLPSTIKQGKPGTGERVAPLYYGFKFDEFKELEIDNRKALHIQEKPYGTDRVLVPLNDKDLLFIQKDTTNSVAPLGDAIISSVKFNSPAN